MNAIRLGPAVLLGWCLLLAGRAVAQPGAGCTVFVVGGSSRSAAELAQTLRTVTAQAAALPTPGTLVVADDQLARRLQPAREEAAARPAAAALLMLLRTFPGQLVIVPGGRDARRDEQVAALLAAPAGRRPVVLPSGQCPEPVELPLDGQHTLVILNTAWWLRPPEAPAPASPCAAQDPAAVLALLDDVLRRNQGRQVLLVGQHALALGSWHLPLLPNPSYRLLRASLRATLEHYPGLTYVSGYGLRRARYDLERGLHYFSSGATARFKAAGGPAPVVEGGFSRLSYPPGTDSVRASYWVPAAAPAGRCVAQVRWLAAGRLPPVPAPADSLAPAAWPADTVVRASTRYQAGHFRTWLAGANYRREWQQPLRVPVLRLATAQGGLTPLKRGGGLQTKSLRLRAADGREFVLRSVEKNTDGSVPGFLHRTVAAAIVQDQVSAAHPYAALLVPPLAEAAGVGHTNPRLVLVPDDPRLGIYRREWAGTLALLEARDPAPPRSFGGRPLRKAYSTSEVLALLQADPRHRVDQRAVLRARLLDMVLADWDRHDDQWRWLAYPRPGGGLLFRAVPRDRDQALFVNEGFLPRRARAPYLLPRIQGFATDFQNVNTFNTNARYFDRSFLTQLSRADWRALADSVQASLTDSVLLAGLRQWPDSIRRLSGAVVLAKLQAHRARLPAWADQYYRFLARAVDVVGTDAPEEFAVQRLSDAQTQVTVYERPATGLRGAVRYQRTFQTDETSEIRLYGQGGADVFSLRGTVGHGPVVRVVGGEGVDTLRDSSRVRAGWPRTHAYDAPGGLVAARGPDTRLQLGALAASRSQYDRAAFRYPFAGPLYPWSYNVDDGLFVGAGLLLRRPGFGREPWAATHTFTGNVALRTGAFSFGYAGDFTRLIGAFDVQVQAQVQAPNYVRNFYGLGNDTPLVPEEPTGAAYYRVRFRHLSLAALLRRPLGARGAIFGGPVYQGVAVENQPGRLLGQLADARLRPATLFAPKHYAGARLGFELTSLHARAELPQGLRWHTELLALAPLNGSARPLAQLTSALAVYRSFRLPLRLTLAARVGGTVNLRRDYEFFQAATLGGLTDLRGYGRTRFAGRQSLYNNLEVRVEVARFRTYLLPATVGLLAFHDAGRVWVPGEASATWHQGYGPGVWLAPTPQLVLAALYGFSPEARLPLVRVGFFF